MIELRAIPLGLLKTSIFRRKFVQKFFQFFHSTFCLKTSPSHDLICFSDICDKDACPNSLTCVVSDDNRKECSCVAPEYLMNIKGPVCGTDGNTYASAIILFQHACQAGLRSLKMDYYGKCKSRQSFSSFSG